MENSCDTIPTRPSLLHRMRDLGDQESWGEFFDTYWRLIFNVALRTGLRESEAEDVVQETMRSIAKLMPDFKYNPALGSFRGFQLQVTRRRIVDEFRKRTPEICASDLLNPVESSQLDPLPVAMESELESIWNIEWQSHLLEKATERVRRRVDPKHYQLFHLFVVECWSVEEIQRTMEVSAHLIYKVKERISKLIQTEIKNLEQKLV